MKKFFVKALAFTFLCALMCTASVFAANSIDIDSVSIGEYVVGGTKNDNYAVATVKYTATEDTKPLDTITFVLSASTLEDTVAGNEAKVVYLDEISAPETGQYSFIIEKSRLQSALGKSSVSGIEGCNLYFNMGGTDVQTAAVERFVYYSPGTTMYGDIYTDGYVSAADAMAILRYDAKMIDLTEQQLLIGDILGDGTVNAVDAMAILRLDAGILSYEDIMEFRNAN